MIPSLGSFASMATVVAATACVGGLLQWRFYRTTCNWWPSTPGATDRALLAGLLAAVLAWPLTLLMAVALLAQGVVGSAVGWTIVIAGSGMLLATLVVDLDAYAISSFHLIDYRAFLTLEQPGRWVGGWRRLTPVARRALGYGLVQSLLGVAIASTLTFPGRTAAVPLAALAAILLSPSLLWLSSRPAVVTRVLQLVLWPPWNARPRSAERVAAPELRALQERVTRPRPVPADPPARVPQSSSALRRPSILLLVIDSWRADAFTPEVMPRLWNRAAGGLSAERHYSAGNATHTGMFALLYGQSPIWMRATFDAAQPPLLPARLAALGYRTFARALQVKWLGLEWMFASRHYDVVHDIEEAQWASADARTLELSERLLIEASGPALAVGHLLACHFPYMLPPDDPNGDHLEQHWNFTGFQTTGVDAPARAIWRRRYERSLAWLDARINALLDRLDLANTVVVITGDHGESHGEDGRWLHSSRLSDVQMRTPLVMLGRDVPARRLNGITTGEDVAPTLLRLAGELEPVSPYGCDLLTAPPRDSACLVSFWQRDACLLSTASTHRLQLAIDPVRAKWRVAGFLDVCGELQPLDWTPPDVAATWQPIVDREVDRLTRAAPGSVDLSRTNAMMRN